MAYALGGDTVEQGAQGPALARQVARSYSLPVGLLAWLDRAHAAGRWSGGPKSKSELVAELLAAGLEARFAHLREPPTRRGAAARDAATS